MAQNDEPNVQSWLRDGIAAAKAGDKEQARELLMRVIEQDERNEQGWLWLSGVVDSDEDRLVCLENVLTLNPDNVRARAGIGLLRERGVQIDEPSEGEELDGDVELIEPAPFSDGSAPPVSDAFLGPDGCVYCGRTVGERDARCPHCGGRLVTKQFRRAERSPIGYLLHAYWIVLACVNVADAVIIGYVWKYGQDIPGVLKGYLPYIVGPVVTGSTTIDTFIDTDGVIQVVRYLLLALTVLAALVALGLFLRRPKAHVAGIALIGLHLIFGVALFMLGFLGSITAVFRGLLTVMLTIFMFNTVEDFAQEEQRERLVPDRRAVNDTDFYVRGREYEKRGMWAKALLHWRRAAAINPARDTYYAAMARAYTHLGRYADALREVDEAMHVGRDPEEWRPLRELVLEAQRRPAPGP
jgi:tetratricopeptide (TPR) repeat protein